MRRSRHPHLATPGSQCYCEQIRLQLTPQQQAILKTERVVNPDAYEDYLRGHYVIQTGAIDGYERSIVYSSQCISIRRSSGKLHRAWTYAQDTSRTGFSASAGSRITSDRIDESLAEAHLALANVKFLNDWDFPSAEQEFRRALEVCRLENPVVKVKKFATWEWQLRPIGKRVCDRSYRKPMKFQFASAERSKNDNNRTLERGS